MVEAFIERRHGQFLAQEEAACPKCERVLRARPSRSRTVETLLGPVPLERPYFYCVSCEHGFYPLDEALGLSGHRKQWDVQNAGVKLALEMPHQRAAKLLDELTDASMSDCVIHEVLATDRVVGRAAGVSGRGRHPGSHCSSRRRSQVAAHRGVGHRRWPTCPVVPRPPKGLVRGARRAGLGEGVGRVNTTKPRAFDFYLVDDERIEQLISWHQMGDEQAFGSALRQVKEAGLIPEEQVRLCAIGDGAADGSGNGSRGTVPEAARQILDYYAL